MNLKKETLNYLTQIEVKNLEKLEALKRRRKRVRLSMINYGDIARKMTKKKTANPIVRLLYLPMIVRAWKNFAGKKKEDWLIEEEE